MPHKVFIDGRAGTTGLALEERLRSRADITLLSLPDDLRRDPAARAQERLRVPAAEDRLEFFDDVHIPYPLLSVLSINLNTTRLDAAISSTPFAFIMGLS